MQKIGGFLPEPWGIIVGIILPLIPLIVIGIDSYKMDAVERIRLTNIGKIRVFVARVIVVSIAGGVILLVFSNFIEIEGDPDLPMLILSSFILSFLLTLFTFVVVNLIFKLLSVKTVFYIEVIGIGERVRIARKMDKKTYLLKYGSNKSMHYEAEKLLNTVIYEELKTAPIDKGFMFWLSKHAMISLIISASIAYLGMILIEYFTMIKTGSVLFILGTIFLLVTTIAFKNHKTVQRLRS